MFSNLLTARVKDVEEAASPLLKSHAHELSAPSLSQRSQSGSRLPRLFRFKFFVICICLSFLCFAVFSTSASTRKVVLNQVKRLPDAIQSKLPFNVEEEFDRWSDEVVEIDSDRHVPIVDQIPDDLLLSELERESNLLSPLSSTTTNATLYEGMLASQKEHPNAIEQEITHVTFHQNGYMLLPDQPVDGPSALRHPIFDLIERGNEKWRNLLKKQSQTLSQAMEEYRNRYKRNPPKGFDKWWKFAVDNNVTLKDEYDQINRDLKPFYALEPTDLRFKSEQIKQRPEIFTISVDPTAPVSDQISYSGPEAGLARATDLGELISMFAGDLPFKVDLTFTRDDQPSIALSWNRKNQLIELADEGELLSPSDVVDVVDPALTYWANACPPGSPLREAEKADPSGSDSSSMSRHRSFIHDHRAAMDVCQHPEIMPLHGFTTSLGTNLGDLLPLFTFAKSTIHSDILATPLEQYSPTYIGDDPDWESKSINKVLWRGSTTGAEFAQHVDWQRSQRARLHFLSHATEGSIPLMYADKDGLQKQSNFTLEALNKAYLDTSFAGGPAQCDPETCEEMSRIIDFAPTMGLDESYQYKYVIDVDGNAWSGRFHRLMSTKSLVLKSTLFPEWYADRLVEWVHYVPVKIDYTDLYDVPHSVLAFFIGTPEGEHAHDDIAQSIATAGREWARDHWRREDMASYMFRLLLEWGQTLNRSDDDLGFT